MDVWDTYVDAPSAAAAEEAAQRLWDDEGPEAFSLHDDGLDGVHVDECAPECAPLGGEGGGA